MFIFVSVCQNDSLALTSSHHKKHITTQSSKNVSESVYTHHGRNRLSNKRHLATKTKHTIKHAARPRYAYPMGFFLMEPPAFESTPLPEEISAQVKKAFYGGFAGEYPTRSLVRTGLVSYYPMRGGIFWRREPIKYIIMHSTEPGISVGAKTIIDGWSHGGRRHAGAHYVIDRDGTIYQAVDPDLATVHINIFKTLPGINNDNSVGIEMCHHGNQDYPPALVESAARLAGYLQSHYNISDANIITHRYAQQGDHTDPVNFGWDNFIAQKDSLLGQGLNQKIALMKLESFNWKPVLEQPAAVVVDKKPSVNQSKTDLTIIDLSNKTGVYLPRTAPSKPSVSKLIPTESKVESTTQTKVDTNIQSALEARFGSINKPVQSPFEAKFGQINDQTIEKQEVKINTTNKTVNEAPVPTKTDTEESVIEQASFQTIITTPIPSNGTARLVPPPAQKRLVPFSIIINTPQSNSTNQQPNTSKSRSDTPQSGSSLIPVSTGGVYNSKRLLPLRGPIEMDPNDAASLLGQ